MSNTTGDTYGVGTGKSWGGPEFSRGV